MGWWITLGILLLLFLLLQLSVTLYLAWGEETHMAIGIAGFRYDLMKDREKPKPQKDKPEKKKKVREKPEQEEPKGLAARLKSILSDGKDQSFPETVQGFLELLSGLGRPIKKMLRSIRVEAFCYELWVGAEDAHQTAIHYAALSAAFYQALALLQTQIRITCKRIRFNADFTSDHLRQQGSMKVKFRVSTALACGISIFFKLIRNVLRKKFRAEQEHNAPKPVQTISPSGQ